MNRSVLTGLAFLLNLQLSYDTSPVRVDEECVPYEYTRYICIGKDVYALDDCGNIELVEKCVGARCYWGSCEEEAYRR